MDENGNEIIKPKYADFGDFSEQLAWVCISKSGDGFGFRGNKYGYINSDGCFSIPPIFDDASTFINGNALVFIGDN
ncbi:MAG: WG repeat-containing protein, partial [Muribaculaceae bacterium]|nr:WG repeat-containing protein [Muribaculaceae bacterium]